MWRRRVSVSWLASWLVVVGLIDAPTLRAQELGGAEVAPDLEVDLDPRRDATVRAVERVMPAVVNIATRSWSAARRADPVERMMEEFFGYRRQQPAAYSRGSGVVIDPEGYVITNVHVVGDAEDIWVQFSDTMESLPARRVALSQGRDVALLKIDAPTERVFKAVSLAPDDDLLLGETVLALGNPFGLGGSVSRGILSARARRSADEANATGRLEWQDWLQTDAAINPGNSGGALVNLNGDLMGINVAVMRPEMGAQGIGFAIPARQIREALAETLSGETIEGYWFGARLQPELRHLVVRGVQSGSPAATAGLEPGDIILKVDQEAARGLIEFHRVLVRSQGARPIELLVRRGASDRTLSLKLVPESEFFNLGLIRERLGVTVRPVRGGLLVQAVEPASQAARKGLRKGMFIIGHEGIQSGGVIGLAKALHARKPGESIVLELLVDQGWSRYRARVDVSVR